MLNSKIIGNKITEARKKINISQAQLAKLLFISSQAVGKWERGESMPDIITLNHLAEILGVDLNYFSERFQSSDTEVKSLDSLVNQSTELTSSNAMLYQSLNQNLTGNTGKKLNWDMSHGNWVDADFSGLKDLHEKFSSSNMQRCRFIGSELSGLLLNGNNIDKCDFSSSDISNSQIKGSNLANNTFKDCSLVETEFSASYVMGCDFSGVDFTRAVFKSGGFQNNTTTNAIWNQTSFNALQIIDTIFGGTMADCSFENCTFKKVTFQNARLINTFFKNKSLKKISFIDCEADRMTYAFLKNGKADLSGITIIPS